MRILLVNKFIFPKGGAETYTFDVGKMLEEHGHEVQYFGLENEKNIVGNRVDSYVTNMDFSQGIHLVKKADLAFSRDTQSAQEMHELGVENLVVATDLAFALPYYKEKYDLNSSKRKVGINVSSLLWDGGHNIKLKVNYREYCRQIIKKYSEDDKTEIHIIPHVIDEDNYDSLENDSRVFTYSFYTHSSMYASVNLKKYRKLN